MEHEITTNAALECIADIGPTGIFLQPGNKPFDILGICEDFALVPNDYKVTITLSLDTCDGIGKAEYEVKSTTKMTFYASWHDGELKNHPGDLGDWWSNDIICLVNPERMLLHDAQVPANTYLLRIEFGEDDR